MRIIKWVAIVTIVAAIAAWFTRPGEQEFDAMLRGALLERIASAEVSTEGNAPETLALLACKLRPSDCFDVMRAALNVTFTDRPFTTEVTITGAVDATCTGAFTHFWCSKELAQP